MSKDNQIMSSLAKKVDEMSLKMEKMKFVDYVYYLEHPRRMLWANFINGLSRGFGIAIGFTILGAIAIYVLQIIVKINLPYIGQFISDIIKIVEMSNKKAY